MKNPQKVKVMVVDDSNLDLSLFKKILSSDKDFSEIYLESSGKEALEHIEIHKPDVMVVDINMPEMDGYELTRRVLEKTFIPIVIISGVVSYEEMKKSYRAIDAGAIAVLPKPKGVGKDNFFAISEEINQTIKSAMMFNGSYSKTREFIENPEVYLKSKRIESIAIGVSMGGPKVILEILKELDKDFPLPILIALHTLSDFFKAFVDWLDLSIPLQVKEIKNGDYLEGSGVWCLPPNKAFNITSNHRAFLKEDSNSEKNTINVDRFFTSIAESYRKHTMGIILTGSGRDGALGLKILHDQGAMTIAQDQSTSTSFSMPLSAIESDGVDYILCTQQIKQVFKILKEIN